LLLCFCKQNEKIDDEVDDSKYWMTTPRNWHPVFAGACAGVFGTLVGSPLDVVKARMQVLRNLDLAGSRSVPLYHNMFHCFRHTFIREGASAFFKGVTAPLVSLTVLMSVTFGTNVISKRWVERRFAKKEGEEGFDITRYSALIGGVSAGFAIGPFISPFECVKVRAQLNTRPGQEYKGVIFTGRAMVRRYGILSLYTGLSMMWPREMLYGLTYFGIYGTIKPIVTKCIDDHSVDGSLFLYLAIPVCGGVSGMCAWTVVFPTDIVKTNVMGQKHPRGRKSVSLLETTRNIYKNGGLRGFYNGLTPCVARAFVVSATRWSSFELSLYYIEQFSKMRAQNS